MKPLTSKNARGKPLVYEALSTLSQNFEKVLLDLERLKDLGLFRDRFPRKFPKPAVQPSKRCMPGRTSK